MAAGCPQDKGACALIRWMSTAAAFAVDAAGHPVERARPPTRSAGVPTSRRPPRCAPVHGARPSPHLARSAAAESKVGTMADTDPTAWLDARLADAADYGTAHPGRSNHRRCAANGCSDRRRRSGTAGRPGRGLRGHCAGRDLCNAQPAHGNAHGRAPHQEGRPGRQHSRPPRATLTGAHARAASLVRIGGTHRVRPRAVRGVQRAAPPERVWRHPRAGDRRCARRGPLGAHRSVFDRLQVGTAARVLPS